MALVQFYRGRADYGADFPEGSQRLFVSLACRVGDHPDRLDALLDTASEWCVLTPRVAKDLGIAVESGSGSVVLHCRFRSIRGECVRIPVEFLAAEGEELPIDATWFVSADWPGPLVIGWKGCLERFRFALDPGDESFCFGEL
jgi:hypothetical protein